MMELGKYTLPVLLSYGVSIALLALLIWQSLSRNARARRALARQEGKRDAH